jgi:nucleoredoxin
MIIFGFVTRIGVKRVALQRIRVQTPDMTKNLILFLLLVFSASAEETFRQWGTIAGGQFEAKLNSVGNRTVELENLEGKTIDFPMVDLKPSDQEFARDWQLKQNQNGDGPAGAKATAERTKFAEQVYRELLAVKGRRLKTFEPEPGDAPKYFAFYRSAMWCPPCRGFTPDLVKFYKRQKQKDASFELVFISSDKNEESMEEYMDEYRMPWPAFPHGENKDIVKPNGGGIPNLIVTDANGKKLLDSYDKKGNYIGPSRVMAQLEDLLAKN